MDPLIISKRNQEHVPFDPLKIVNALKKAYRSASRHVEETFLVDIAQDIRAQVAKRAAANVNTNVEDIQDLVEIALIDAHHHDVLKRYIIYRNLHQHMRMVMEDFKHMTSDHTLLDLLRDIQETYNQEQYSLQSLHARAYSFYKAGMSTSDTLDLLIKSAVELTTKEAPNWEFIASKLLYYKLEISVAHMDSHKNITCFYDKLHTYTAEGYYGQYLLEHYSEQEVAELELYLDKERNALLTYSALNLIIKRYLLRTCDNQVIERPQEMFMGIAMHLAIPEKDNKVLWAKRFYDIISALKVTMATPTMSNARKPHHQLSSCFIDTVADSLDGIYKSIDHFAQVSKAGGGMGLYFGKIRANGSSIRGFKGVAGGVVRWIKLANDTAVAVDQLGVRQGSVAVYLDVWHKDIPEFLQLKTNNGDDRGKAHDVFPGICYPDLFWKQAKESLDNVWYMMCPHEIKTVKGYALEDFYGTEWEEKYYDCVYDPRIDKREILIKDLVRLIIKSAIETGTPFAFNRDTVNEMNPNKHKGIIYSSNLCVEIAQNMSEAGEVDKQVIIVDGDEIIVEKRKAGDFVVCNLASLVLGNINTDDDHTLKDIIETTVRALDNVIDMNAYPLPNAHITNKKYRALGLGTSGYHHLLAKREIDWESEAHFEFVDELYERINYHAICASSKLAKEKGVYTYFEGSDWQMGDYFKKRGYNSEKWLALKESIAKDGMRNAYLMAIAPTGSTSIIAGTTASIDPVMHTYFLEEKKGDIVPRVAPDLTPRTFWLYKSAHIIDQHWSIKAAGIRQRHIDQSQSLNLYITTEHTMRQILDLYISAWESGVKTIYYIRSKSLEVEECDMCMS